MFFSLVIFKQHVYTPASFSSSLFIEPTVTVFLPLLKMGNNHLERPLLAICIAPSPAMHDGMKNYEM